MIVRVDCGGLWVYFGLPQAPVIAEPFYPYLEAVEPIAEANGQESASASFTLSRAATDLIDLNVRREVTILDDELEEELFSGLIGRISYTESINVTAEA